MYSVINIPLGGDTNRDPIQYSNYKEVKVIKEMKIVIL